MSRMAVEEAFYRRVRDYVRRHEMVRPGECVVAGVSGGADSTCLVLVLDRMAGEMGFSLQAVHVHHGLRASADGDRDFVVSLCRARGIPCHVVQVDARAEAARRGCGIEEAGRLLRYRAFARLRRSWEEAHGSPCRVAVAHHREDQAETVLFRLCRGTDLCGAGGMRPLHALPPEEGGEGPAAEGALIRPLLAQSRADIEAYLRARHVAWRQDETNADTAYSRNFLRHEILPRLSAGVHPAAAAGIARFASACAAAEDYLRAQTQEAWRRCVPQPGKGLSVPALLREDPYIAGRVLHKALADCAGTRRDIGAVHVEALRALCLANEDGRLSLPGRVTAFRRGQDLFFARGEAASGMDCPGKCRLFPAHASEYECRILEMDKELCLNGENKPYFPEKKYTKWFDYDKMGMLPVFRARRPGDKMRIGGHAPIEKKLARVMLDAGIPADMRGGIILPFCGDQALWLPGVRMGDAYKISSATRRVLEICWPPGREMETC